MELAESVSMAFLIVLETLGPDERVAFVLHEVFGHTHGEIAEVLAPEVVLRSDGGGQVSAAQHPIVGAERVARFLLGVAAQAPAGTRLQQLALNGAPGLLVWRPDGTLDTAMMLDVAHGQVQAVSVVRNPDKLTHLTATADRTRRHGSQLLEL